MKTVKKVRAPFGSFACALGEVCLKRRRAMKLTQVALAKKAGVNKDCPSTAEYGGVRIKLDTLLRLSTKGFEVDLDKLIREALDLQQEHLRSLERAAALRAAASSEIREAEIVVEVTI